MHIQSKYSILCKITATMLLSITGSWLFLKGYYFSSFLALISIFIVAVSIYDDRKKLIERMRRMIRTIRHSDFSSRFIYNPSDNEMNQLMKEMNEALEAFRSRTEDAVTDEAETLAWQKLISVLTHEMMNSIAPIISISETLSEQDKINRQDLKIEQDSIRELNTISAEVFSREVDQEKYLIMQQAMETIHRRSKGLLSFVENYRSLTRLPQPIKQPIQMNELLKYIHQLTTPYGINFTWSVYPTQLILNADKTMIEQLLINLLKNAHEACSGLSDSKIVVKTEKVGENIELTVSDNGKGISPEAIDKIFIPFYTTKINGSGIGLSLCRQIVSRHKAKISVQSGITGTTFKIEFP